MNEWRIGWVVAILQLWIALTHFGVFWKPWDWLVVVGQSTTISRLMFIASLLFISLPLVAVVGLWSRRFFAFYALAAFPAVAFVFGTVPIPYASYFYSPDVSLNSWIIAVVDASAVILAVVLLMLCQRRSNKSLHRPPESHLS